MITKKNAFAVIGIHVRYRKKFSELFIEGRQWLYRLSMTNWRFSLPLIKMVVIVEVVKLISNAQSYADKILTQG